MKKLVSDKKRPAFLLLLGTGIIIFLSVLNLRRFETSIVSQNLQNLATIASAEALSIRIHFQDIRKSLESIAINVWIHRSLKEGITGDKIAARIGFSPLKAYFKDLEEKADIIYLIDTQGKIRDMAPYIREFVGDDYLEKPGTWQSLRDKSLHVSDVYMNYMKLNVLSVNYPVFDGQNNFLGIVRAVISLEKLNAMLDHFPNSQKSYMMIMDSQGTIIRHPDKRLIGKEFVSCGLIPPELDPIEVSAKLFSGRNGSISHNSGDGNLFVLAYTPVKVMNQQWVIAVTVDQEPMVRAITGYARSLEISAGVFIIILVWSGYLFLKYKRRKIYFEEEARARRILERNNLLLKKEIHDREKMEEKLQETERNQSAMLDNISDIVWLKDKDGRYVAVNAAFARSCGRLPREIVGLTDFDLWPRDLAEGYRRCDEKLMATGVPQLVVELIEDHSVKKAVWFEAIKSPVIGKNGETVGITGIGRNFEQRKEYEEQLLKLNRMFLGIGPDFDRNLQKIVDACGDILSADIVLLYKLSAGKPVFAAGWNLPPRFPHSAYAGFYENVYGIAEGDRVKVVRGLVKAGLERKEPLVGFLGLETLMCCPIFRSGEPAGFLCALYKRDFEPGSNCKRILEIAAAAIGIEEERRNVDDTLKARMFELERFNKFAVDRELKMVDLKKRLAEAGKIPSA